MASQQARCFYRPGAAIAQPPDGPSSSRNCIGSSSALRPPPLSLPSVTTLNDSYRVAVRAHSDAETPRQPQRRTGFTYFFGMSQMSQNGVKKGKRFGPSPRFHGPGAKSWPAHPHTRAKNSWSGLHSLTDREPFPTTEDPACRSPRPSPAQVSALPFVLFVCFCSKLVCHRNPAWFRLEPDRPRADQTSPRKCREQLGSPQALPPHNARCSLYILYATLSVWPDPPTQNSPQLLSATRNTIYSFFSFKYS